MKIKKQASPCCGYVIDSATLHGVEDGKGPEPGDVSVCLQCGVLSEYTAPDLVLVLLSPEKQYDICMKDPEMWDEIIKLQKAVRILRAVKK